MQNYSMEFSFDDIPMSNTVRRQRRASFISTTSLVKYDNNRNNFIFESGKNRKLSNLIVKECQEEEEEEEKVANSSIDDVIRQLRNELQQTRALVSELETRLELTEQTSQVIVGELKNLLSENESESHTTAVEIDHESEEVDNMKFDLNDDGDDSDDDEFYVSSSFINQTYQEEIPIPSINVDVTSSQIEPTTTSTTSSDSLVVQHAEDTNDSFNRICSALQNLINDGQVALQKPNSSSHQLLGLPQTTTRPRAQSWSSNVSSWIMNQYNPYPVVCECGACWLCLESSSNSLPSTTATTTRTTPKSSRANSMTSVQRPSLSLTSKQQESYDTYNRQVNMAGIKKQYRKRLENRSYRKSCDDLEMELQKLITTAISAGVEHGLMHSPVYREYMEREDSCDRYSYFRNNDEETSDGEGKFSKYFGIFYGREQLEDANNNNDNNKESSKWRRRIWNYLQKMVNNYKINNKENAEEEVVVEDENDEYGSYGSYSSYNSSWKPSSRDYQENSNEDSSNPFPSSFINTLNIGQNILNFNVNLINSTTNNYNKTTINEIDNSIHTTSTTNNYHNCTNLTNNNNHEEKLSQLNFTAKENIKSTATEKFKSLGTKFTNLLAMIGLMISMSQTIVLNPTSAPALMSVAARNIIRRSIIRRRGRSGRDIILMIKVIKYATLLLVGWAAGRIGKKSKDSSNKNNRIKEIPSNN